MTHFWTGLYLCILSHADPSIAIKNWEDENIIRDVTRSEFLLHVRGGGLIISGDMKYNILFSVSSCVQSGKALIHNWAGNWPGHNEMGNLLVTEIQPTHIYKEIKV